MSELSHVTLGTLASVGSLTVTSEATSIFLNWTAPFTLDISGVGHDITYCVEMSYTDCGINTTVCGMNKTDCGINTTELTFPKPPMSNCNNASITVTPVNVVGPGMPNTIQYFGVQSSKFSKGANAKTMI